MKKYPFSCLFSHMRIPLAKQKDKQGIKMKTFLFGTLSVLSYCLLYPFCPGRYDFLYTPHIELYKKNFCLYKSVILERLSSLVHMWVSERTNEWMSVCSMNSEEGILFIDYELTIKSTRICGLPYSCSGKLKVPIVYETLLSFSLLSMPQDSVCFSERLLGR